MHGAEGTRRVLFLCFPTTRASDVDQLSHERLRSTPRLSSTRVNAYCNGQVLLLDVVLYPTVHPSEFHRHNAKEFALRRRLSRSSPSLMQDQAAAFKVAAMMSFNSAKDPGNISEDDEDEG